MASRLEQLLKKQEELKAQIRKEKNQLVLAELHKSKVRSQKSKVLPLPEGRGFKN